MDERQRMKLDELVEAIADADPARAARALAGGADPNGIQLPNAWTPAMFACRGFPRQEEEPWMKAHLRGRAECLALLLDAGADPNARSPQDWLPACWAARDGNVDSLRLLIDRGADVASAGRFGSSPLHMGCGAHQVDAVRMLLRHIGIDALGSDGLENALGYTASPAADGAPCAIAVCEAALEAGFEIEPLVDKVARAYSSRLWGAEAMRFCSSWRELRVLDEAIGARPASSDGTDAKAKAPAGRPRM